MEFRPRLQSVNVFIILKNDIAQECRLKFDDDYLQITIDNEEEIIELDNSFLVSAVSSLVAKRNFISFRSMLQRGTMRRFKAELLSSKLSNLKVKLNECKLIKEVPYRFFCKKCFKTLGECNFKRILPLPMHSEHNDWYCHASEDTHINLNPSTTDFFYTKTFFHVNSSSFKGTIKGNKILYCNNCDEWLGDYVNRETSKLWFSTLNIINEDNVIPSDSLSDCFAIIKECFAELPLTSLKISLNWQKDDSTVDYLLLWVLEKNLSVHIVGEGKKNVCKVLYRFDDELQDDWVHDSINQNVAVSKPMFLAIGEHLRKMGEYIPTEFNISNGFYVSYLSLYDYLK